MTFLKKFLYLSFSFPVVQCESYKLILSSTAPAIDGVNVTFIGDVTINGHVPYFTSKLDWVRSNHSYISLFIVRKITDNSIFINKFFLK